MTRASELFDQDTYVSIFSAVSSDCLGSLRLNCDGLIEAFDSCHVLLGVFETEDVDDALNALPNCRKAKPKVARNGGDDPMLAAALSYAEFGWDVFPAPPGEKKSYKSAEFSNGAKWGKTHDPELIRKDFQRWPKANVGIPTGVENGIFVVETDTKKGHDVDGLAGMKQLEAKHGQLPDTLMAASPSGSIHRYFNHPGGDIEIKNSVSELAPGVDVRGDGGMVIAPPSVRKDGTYRWINDLEIADAPGWLIELVKKQPRTPRLNGGGQSTSSSQHGAQLADTGELAAAMAVIPNNNSTKWTEWNNIGMALWRATDGSSEGLDLFDSWSQTWPHGYDAAYTAARWDGYEKCPPTEIGAGTIFYMADQARPTWRRDYEERVARRRAEQIKRNIEIGDGDVAELAVPLILTPKEMIARLVWIGFSGAVVDRVTFRIRKKEQAFSEYAASVYVPKEGEEKEGEELKSKTPKAKTKKPIPCLTIWMQSPKRTTVDVLAWVPGEPQLCRPPEGFNNAQTAFNMWRGITPMPTVENLQVLAEPFVDHVAYLVPVESERQRFMQWLAHTIQHPEVLPHTAYLMIAEKTGIGRNWMASVLVRVLRGYVAAGVSLPELLDGGYNGRLSCKLLAIVDELREGPGNQRYQRAQNLKTIITQEHRLINPKFGIQSVERNCCRWLMFSNFFDALPFDNTDRRIETIANPTQRKTAAYYERIYKLLHDPSFIASVWWLLKTMDISSFKPGAHATMNEAKERAVSEMMTDVDRAVCDFKDECGTGLVSRKDIEIAAGIFPTMNTTHLTHAITHAGMLNTGRRVKDTTGTRHPVVIVDRAKWTIAEVKAASVGTLLGVMGKPVKK